MLVLSRHAEESVLVGDDIVVTVLEIRSNQVRLGISAPPELRVDREEVREQIRATDIDRTESAEP